MKITQLVEFEGKDLASIKEFLSDRSLVVLKNLMVEGDIDNIEDLGSNALLLNDLINTLTLENIHMRVGDEEFWMLGIDGMETFIDEYQEYLQK